jgi:hypothetical protein
MTVAGMQKRIEGETYERTIQDFQFHRDRTGRDLLQPGQQVKTDYDRGADFSRYKDVLPGKRSGLETAMGRPGITLRASCPVTESLPRGAIAPGQAGLRPFC